MAEHADVVSDKPGTCPKCGMDLVETSKVGHGEQAIYNWKKTRAGHPSEVEAPTANQHP